MSSSVPDQSTNVEIAKFEAAIYVILALPALIVLFYNVGQTKRNFTGWFFLNTFIGLQLIGALLTIKKGKDAVATGGQILLAIGLSPLLLAVKGCVAQR